jgi:dephospho-CoA kinase
LFTVALTGGIASGKSTVCGLLEKKGAKIIDSDELAREVVVKGKPAWHEIKDHFGKQVLGPEGEVDRQRLAQIVFNDQVERIFLNGVTHPRIFELMAKRIRDIESEAGPESVVVLDIPLLVESKAEGIFDFNLVVDASPESQVERLINQRGISAEEAWSRIRSQSPRSDRLKYADMVILNEGSMEDLSLEVNRAWEIIMKRAS